MRGLCSKWNELEYYRKSLAIKIKVPGGQHEMTALEQRKRVMTKAALIEEIVKMEHSCTKNKERLFSGILRVAFYQIPRFFVFF